MIIIPSFAHLTATQCQPLDHPTYLIYVILVMGIYVCRKHKLMSDII